ncbi:MFS general substrate transporter [Colletotrichum tofieldiae]|nr:MFS general substrate transporter [Colletotrichum tofieldiae]GKT87396.1 MFS general substrate transporter [Colletotrichum tofieldiae]
MAEPKAESQNTGARAASVPVPTPTPGPEPLTLPLGDAAPAELYSIFTRKEKWFIVGMVAVAGFFRHVPTLPLSPLRHNP